MFFPGFKLIRLRNEIEQILDIDHVDSFSDSDLPGESFLSIIFPNFIVKVIDRLISSDIISKFVLEVFPYFMIGLALLLPFLIITSLLYFHYGINWLLVVIIILFFPLILRIFFLGIMKFFRL